MDIVTIIVFTIAILSTFTLLYINFFIKRPPLLLKMYTLILQLSVFLCIHYDKSFNSDSGGSQSLILMTTLLIILSIPVYFQIGEKW